jgi:hypothetical protein
MRIIAFIIVALIAYLGPFWLLLPLALIYAMLFKAPFELFIPALLIDAQFGGDGMLWGIKYTLGIGATVLFAELMKPYLRFHTTLG